MRKIIFIILLLPFSQIFAQSAKKFYKEGKSLYKEGKFQEAVDKLNQAANMDTNLYDAFYYRGLSYEGLKKPEKAVTDYEKCLKLEPKENELNEMLGRNYMLSGNYSKAAANYEKYLEKKKSDISAWHNLIICKMNLKDYLSAVRFAGTCVEQDSHNDYSHFLKASAIDSTGDYQSAINNYQKAISLLPSKKDPAKHKIYYLQIGKLQRKLKQNDESIKNLNLAAGLDPNDADIYYERGLTYSAKNDLINATLDLNKSISINDKNPFPFLERGRIYQKQGQFTNAIGDFTKTILLNGKLDMAFQSRGACYENLGKLEEAIKDYESAIALYPTSEVYVKLHKDATNKLFEQNRESVPPVISLIKPLPTENNILNIPQNKPNIELSGSVKDQSKIQSIMINETEVGFDKNTLNPNFQANIPVFDKSEIVIKATDVYNNVQTLSFTLNKTETDAPLVSLKTPFLSPDKEVFIEVNTPSLFVEGQAQDENLIKSISINGIQASFNPAEKNPSFTATLSNFSAMDTMKIQVADILDNQITYKYAVNKSAITDQATNPMGKTWVVFVENSNYKNLQSLNGPAEDVTMMRSALTGYNIDKVIVKKDLTKEKLEKFFAIELRDMVKNTMVNSLVIWYAGHGKFINESGYWIPVDAAANEEFTYFPISNLKGYIASYRNLKHILVVSDACETGPAFYLTMRDAEKPKACGDWSACKFKSAQVFTSSNEELSSDNSLFTRTFAKSLTANPDNCISTEAIVEKVSKAVRQNMKQVPKFGKISGLDDENGTFFFIKK